MMEAAKRTDSVDMFRTAEITVLPGQTDKTIPFNGYQKRFLSIEETAECLGLSVHYLRQGIRTGKIPFIKCGCKSMINIAKLIEMLDAESVNGNCR